MKKKVLFLTSLVVVVAGLSTSVMAAENTVVTSNETEKNEIVAQELTYQDVLDKLNAEYGTNAHFPDENSYRKINLTLEEFEVRIRHAIELNIAANEKADEAIKRLTPDRIEGSGNSIVIGEGSSRWENGKLIVTCNSQMASSTYSADYDYRNTKLLEDVVIELEGRVNCERGFWAFSSIDEILFDSYSYMDNIFVPVRVNRDFADTRRTYYVEAYGEVTEAFTDVVIDSNARRYVEFWAGSGMPDPSTLVA